jgi:hypothetical protein
METEKIKEGTLLESLIDCGYSPQDYADKLNCIAEGNTTLDDYEGHPQCYDDEEINLLRGDIEDWENDLKEMRAEWHRTHATVTADQMKDEEQIIIDWCKERG